MADGAPIQGELQTQLMTVMWRLGSGSVEDVRQALPPRYRGAYTTVQTVLNRLSDRGLLSREKDGRNIVYRPSVTEAQYLSQTIRHTLAGASNDARQAALAELIGGLDSDELGELRKLAQQAGRARASRRT
jgi:predicted transcriptional regulator